MFLYKIIQPLAINELLSQKSSLPWNSLMKWQSSDQNTGGVSLSLIRPSRLSDRFDFCDIDSLVMWQCLVLPISEQELQPFSRTVKQAHCICKAFMFNCYWMTSRGKRWSKVCPREFVHSRINIIHGISALPKNCKQPSSEDNVGWWKPGIRLIVATVETLPLCKEWDSRNRCWSNCVTVQLGI